MRKDHSPDYDEHLAGIMQRNASFLKSLVRQRIKRS